MSDVDYGVCDCCHDEPAVGVAAIPYIPMSIAWGRKCLDADIIPYWAAVANTAACGGWEHCNQEWQDLCRDTCTYFGEPHEQFLRDVAKDIELMANPDA
jgi:hypothetical protein